MSIIKNEATQRVIKIVIFALLIVGIVAGGFFGGKKSAKLINRYLKAKTFEECKIPFRSDGSVR